MANGFCVAGSIMIESKVTFYVFFSGAAAVVAMLAYQLFKMIWV